MKTIKHKYNLLLIIILAFTSTANAQSSEYNENVTVIGTYQTQLSEAKKISFTPEQKDTLVSVPTMTYKILPALIQIPTTITSINASKASPEIETILNRNYLKAGFGNYKATYIEYFYQTSANKKLRGGIHLKHLASAGKIKDYAFPGQSDNAIKAYGGLISGNYIFQSDISYNRDAIHYYGFKTNEALTDFAKNDIRQIFKMLDFNISAESKVNNKNTWHNKFGLSYLGLWDEYNAKENLVLAKINIKKNFNLARFIKDESFNIDINGGFYGQETLSKQMNNGLIAIKPYIKMRFDDLEITGGINTSGIIDNVGKLYFHPIARLDIYLVPDYLKIFFGLDGSVSRNTFREYININPFINTEYITFNFTETKRELQGGVIGGFGGIFNYKIQANNKQIKDMALFINDTLPLELRNDTLVLGKRFKAIHDNIDIFSVSADLSLDIDPKFQILLQSSYHIYSPTNEAKAWHLPLYDGSLSFKYNIQENICAKAKIVTYGTRYAIIDKIISYLGF